MSDEKKLAERLRIPVNPGFDESRDPALQTEYANPVTLNNKTIQLANAYIALTQKWATARQHEYLAAKALRVSEVALEDFEHGLLASGEPSSNDLKNLKTTQAFLLRRATATGERDKYLELMSAVDTIKERLAYAQLRKEQALMWLRAVEQEATNIQTHLSYVKNEMRNSKSYP